jgi:hypothetical protein
METSQSIKEIGKALALFHMKVAKIPKTDTNPFFKSKYAGLPSILDAIQIPLAESNLVFTQLPDDEHLTTLIIHYESGEFIKSSYKMSSAKSDPQSMGSAITYARRYALGAILGLNIDEDDDGNKASQGAAQSQTTTQSATAELPWLNLFNRDKTLNQKVFTGLQTFFAEGKTITDLRLSRKVSKDEAEYITNNIINQI